MRRRERHEGLFYGWVVVAIAALAVVLAAGARSAPGVLLLDMQADTGFTRTTLSLAASLGLVLFGLGAPLSGRLIDRFGPRPVTGVGLLLVAASFALSAQVRTEWQLYLVWGVLGGLGTGIVGSVLGATIASRWFMKHRGLVVGLFGAATSAGQLVFIPALTQAGSALGWRPTVLGIGLLALIVAVPALLLLRDRPRDMGLRPLGATEEQARVVPPDPHVMRRALRNTDFWLLAITFLVCGATSNGLIGTHFIAHAVEHGFTANTAAGVLAVMGAFNFVGTVASGWLTDRFDPRRLLAMYYTFRGASLLMLPFVHDGLGMIVFAVLFGLDYIATVPPTTALVSDTFGRENVGTVYGWVFFAHQAGAASAAWLGGAARDALGDYGLAFMVAGVVAVAGGALALRIRRVGTPVASA